MILFLTILSQDFELLNFVLNLTEIFDEIISYLESTKTANEDKIVYCIHLN